MFVANVNAVPNAPIEVAKQIAPEAIKPGFKAGMIISITILKGGAPRSTSSYAYHGKPGRRPGAQ